ncbi:MAG: tetratricopeptide repeat protein [Planctomycetes bacterium]|nr:tetratricopeptide repeat protein [Planctomycetota bacterium]
MARRLNTRLLVRLLLFVGVPVAALAIVAASGWLSGGDPQKYVEQARALADQGDWAAAWIAVRSAVKAGAGKDPDVQMLVARIALRLTPPAVRPALEAYRAAVALKPDLVDAQQEIVQLYLGLRYWKEARSEVDRLIQMNPSFGKAYLWGAVAEMSMAEAEPTLGRKTPFYEAAVARCQAGIEKAPGQLDLYRLLATAHERLGQSDKAGETLDSCLAANPKDAEAYILKAGRLLALGKDAEAEAVLQKGIQESGEGARLYLALSDVALRRKKLQEARDLLAKALAIDPKNEAAYLRLSSMHRGEGDREKALAVIVQGLEQLPDSKALRADQADILLEQGALAKADSCVNALAKETPDAAVVFYLRGKRAILNMQSRQAIVYLEQARDRQPTPQTRLLLARAYFLADELGAAQGELDALLREQPGLASGWRTLAEVQFRLHDYEKAARSAAKALDANPDDTAMRLLVTQTMMLRNRPADALKEAQAAAQRDKDNPDPYLLMADIYQEMKRPADVEAMYRRAMATGKQGMRVATRFVRYLKDTGQQDKLKAFTEEARKSLGEEEVIELVGGPEEVERVLTARAEKQDASPATILALARLYSYTDRPEQAKEALQKAMTAAKPGAPEWRQAWQQLFMLELMTDSYDKAAALVDQLRKAEPDALEVLFAEPLLSLSQSKLDQALTQLRALCQTHKSASQAHFILGQVLARMRQWDEAVAAISRTLELRPQLVPARLLLGRIHLAQGNYAAVLTEAGEALKYDPRLVSAMELKATAHAGLGAWDQAAAAREEIAKIVPKNGQNLLALGALAIQRHQPEKAEEYFLRALGLAPDNVALVRTLANFYAETSRTAQGQKVIDDYVARHKDESRAYVLRGEFAAATAGPAEAEKHFRKAAELAPNDAAPLVALADRYGQAGEWEKAEAVYVQAIQRAPKDMTAKRRLADVYMLQGKLREAKAAADEVLQADPKDAGALVIAGRIASKQDKADEARRCMEAALAIDPDYGEAKVRLAELYAGPEPLKALDILTGIDPSDASFEKAMLLRSDINTRRVLLAEAILDLRRLLDFRPNSVPGRLALAAKYLAMREPARAGEILQQLSRERLDKDPGILAALADAQVFQQRHADALANYEKARALRPEFAEALVGEARCLVAMNRAADAVTRVHAAMNQFPNEVWPRMALVAIHMRTAQPAKAFEVIRTGLVRRPDWEQGYVMLADLLVQDKKSADARQVLATGLANMPASVPIRAAVATLEVNENRSEAARRILQSMADEFQALYSRTPEKLDRLRPYMGPIRVYSLALYNLGQTDEAVKWGMMLWSLDPTDIANANNMAWILATAYKDYARATEMIQQCMRLLPNHPQVLDTAGWIAFLSGRHQEAADNLLASIKYGDNPEARYHLGRVYEARQRPDEARGEYQKALDMGLAGKDREDALRRLGPKGK